MNKPLIPTPEQCLDLRNAGFEQNTIFWYVKLNASRFDPDVWYLAYRFKEDIDMIFVNVPFQNSYETRIYAFEESMVIDKVAAPTLGEINIDGLWSIIGTYDCKNELTRRIQIWLEYSTESKVSCNYPEKSYLNITKCPRNCVETICNEHGCQEKITQNPIKKPKKSDYGWENPSPENEGGWMIEGGEEAYNKAFELWRSKLSRAKPKETNCNGNCGENMCDEYGCQERKPAKPYSEESAE